MGEYVLTVKKDENGQYLIDEKSEGFTLFELVGLFSHFQTQKSNELDKEIKTHLAEKEKE